MAQKHYNGVIRFCQGISDSTLLFFVTFIALSVLRVRLVVLSAQHCS